MSQNGSQNVSDRPSPSPALGTASSGTAFPGTSHQAARLHTTDTQGRELHPRIASIEENANRLMDAVFGDVEQMLERGAQLQIAPVETVKDGSRPANILEFPEAAAIEKHNLNPSLPTSSPASSPTSSLATLALPPKLSPRQLTKDQGHQEIDLLEDRSDLIQELLEEKPQPKENQSFDRWLMTIAFLCLLITSGIWFFVRHSLSQVAVTARVPSAAEILQAKQDAEFLNYVQRSMERIDRVTQQAEAATSATTGSSTATALEPLYVPLPPPPTITNLPSAVPSPTARISVSPLPPIALSTPALVPTSTPAPVSAPVPAPAAGIPSAADIPSAVIPNIIPSPTHVLIGLLELGDRSAALFEVNGAPQRIQVGEAIASSGWFLVSVSGEEAIVRRNGEVRSIYIGQEF